MSSQLNEIVLAQNNRILFDLMGFDIYPPFLKMLKGLIISNRINGAAPEFNVFGFLEWDNDLFRFYIETERGDMIKGIWDTVRLYIEFLAQLDLFFVMPKHSWISKNLYVYTEDEFKHNLVRIFMSMNFKMLDIVPLSYNIFAKLVFNNR